MAQDVTGTKATAHGTPDTGRSGRRQAFLVETLVSRALINKRYNVKHIWQSSTKSGTHLAGLTGVLNIWQVSSNLSKRPQDLAALQLW